MALYEVRLTNLKIISKRDPIVHIMVDDIDGHARGLLALESAIEKIPAHRFGELNYNELFSHVKHYLGILYPDLFVCKVGLDLLCIYSL